MIITRILVILSFFAVAGSVTAQYMAPAPVAPAPVLTAPPRAPATVAPVASAPTGTCVKPGHYPGKRVSDDRKEAWQKDVSDWGDCVRASVAELRANVTDLKALIDAKIKLANSTVEDYNTGIKELREEQTVAELKGQVGK